MNPLNHNGIVQGVLRQSTDLYNITLDWSSGTRISTYRWGSNCRAPVEPWPRSIRRCFFPAGPELRWRSGDLGGDITG